jgi:polar amino acid transport system substrate-binding protein
MLIIATGEHSDRDAPGVAKRVTVVLMWLLGVVLIAQLTATVTSSQTVERLQSSIRGPDDLPGKTIARV